MARKMNVILVHGAYGNPEENWFPWISEKLEDLGHEVVAPEFPTPDNQSLENWSEILDEYKEYFDRETIVVGHSLGCAFLLSVIEKLDEPIKAAFFVSGFVGRLNNPKFDEINKTFTEKEFDWNLIRKNCKKFVVFHSDNDPYVPLEKSKELSGNLKCRCSLIYGAGHFNEKAGYKKFERLLEEIKELD